MLTSPPAALFGFLVCLYSQFLNLACEGIAPQAEQLRCLDTAPAGVSERLHDECLLEAAGEFVHDAGLAAVELRLDFLLQRSHPARRRRRHLGAQFMWK